MKKRAGFTLLEVLVVVVIVISISAFAVPAYKKAQEHNKYLAAKGVLMSVGSAMQALRGDLANAGRDIEKIGLRQLGSQHLRGVVATAEGAQDLSDCCDPVQNSDWMGYLLFGRKYLSPIAFDGLPDSYTVHTYKGYYIYLCSLKGNANSTCCKANKSENKIACIKKRASKKMDCVNADYPGAYVAEDGTVVDFGKGTTLANDGCS